MSSGGVFSNQAIGGLAVRNLDVSLLARMLHQQKVAGAHAIGLIEAGGDHAAIAAPRADSPPPRGADEPGKGGRVDVVA